MRGARREGFIRLMFRLIWRGYSDATVSGLNRTLPVRLLVALSRPLGRLLPYRNRSALFFFFPFFHVGGAEKVHADIVGCFAGEEPWVFFTKRSKNSGFKARFPKEARLFNLWPLLKYGYPLSAGTMAGFINRHENPVVFGSNSLFYYLLIPFLAPHVRCVDLLHAFGGATEELSLPVVERLCRRVVITGKTVEDLKSQYRTNGIDPAFIKRVTLIENRFQVPETCPEKSGGSPLRVLYVGRGAPEKRVHLIGRAATICRRKNVNADFILVGDTQDAVEAPDRENCIFMGEVSDAARLDNIYADADVLVLVSSREGFPLVVMEAMAHGVVPVCTAVGGIPAHLEHGVNGLLLEDGAEERVVEELADAVARLAADGGELAALSRAAHAHAVRHFGGGGFCASYRRVILGEDTHKTDARGRTKG